ncbi:hypothetical protein ACRALDRAFT_1094356 [Sodiomyces alcalophilus JCM 7366]|uniref:uncharacterized protein n=1 Tax=Sodiomyces alcalophilus JCM 7366 TaxID=591952 RepID=UPI0039B3DB78
MSSGWYGEEVMSSECDLRSRDQHVWPTMASIRCNARFLFVAPEWMDEAWVGNALQGKNLVFQPQLATAIIYCDRGINGTRHQGKHSAIRPSHVGTASGRATILPIVKRQVRDETPGTRRFTSMATEHYHRSWAPTWARACFGNRHEHTILEMSPIWAVGNYRCTIPAEPLAKLAGQADGWMQGTFHNPSRLSQFPTPSYSGTVDVRE